MMRLLILCIIFIAASGVVADPPKGLAPQSDALQIAQKQITALLDALKLNDKETFFKLMKTAEKDKKNFDKFAAVFKGITVNVVTAEMKVNGTIDVVILLAGKQQVKLIMEKSTSSPTGWILDSPGTPNRLTRHFMMKDLFPMCYGILCGLMTATFNLSVFI